MRYSAADSHLTTRLRREGEDLLIDLVQILGFIVILYIGDFAVHLLFGEAKLFNEFPTEWLFQSGDVGLVICFSLRGCLRIFSLLR